MSLSNSAKYAKLMEEILVVLQPGIRMKTLEINDALKRRGKKRRTMTHHALMKLWLIEKKVTCRSVMNHKVWSVV